MWEYVLSSLMIKEKAFVLEKASLEVAKVGKVHLQERSLFVWMSL